MLKIFICAYLLLMCLFAYAGLRHYQNELRNFIQLRHQLLINPAASIEKFCKNQDKISDYGNKSFLFTCNTFLATKQQENICTERIYDFRARRHYFMRLECAFSSVLRFQVYR